MKRILLAALLVTNTLSTGSLFGMQDEQQEIQIHTTSDTPRPIHSLLCSFARNGQIDEFNAYLSNSSICNRIDSETVRVALSNAVFGNRVNIVDAIIKNKITRAKINAFSVIDGLAHASSEGKVEIVSKLLALDLLPIEYLAFMLNITLKDTLSSEARELFNQAIQRKRQAL